MKSSTAQGRRALERVRERYQWDGVASQYEQLFLDLLGKRDPGDVSSGRCCGSSTGRTSETNDQTARNMRV